MSKVFPVTLDRTRYLAKPSGAECAAITRRMQSAGPSLVFASDFCAVVRAGVTWCPGTFEASADGWGEFRGMRLAGLDFDGDEGGASGRSLFERVTERARSLGLCVVCFYPTFSAVCRLGANPAGWTRFRLVIDFGEDIRDAEQARAVIGWLLSQFPEADQQCSNLNRLYFGAPGVCAEAVTWWPSLLGGGAS